MRTNSNDLELVLDKQDIECPAIVKERLLEVSLDELSCSSASLGDGYCWLVSRNNLFVWKQDSDGKIKHAHHLQLPASGLHYSAKSASIVPTATSVGVVAVSGEGVVRCWQNIQSAVFTEETLELQQEVVLAVHRFSSHKQGFQASFLLTTTSGSVFCLRVRSGGIDLEKIGGRSTRSVGRRLSSIIFGAKANSSENSRVVNSIILWGEGGDIVDCDGEDESCPLILTVSPKSLHCFHVTEKSLLWKADVSSLLMEHVTASFERFSRGQSLSNIRIWLLDAAPFRGGVLVLGTCSHEKSKSVTFFLGHMLDCESDAPTLGWFSTVPNSSTCAHLFDVHDSSSFLGRMQLQIPPSTACSNTSSRTDGVLLVHEKFVQSVYVPDDLSRLNELPLNKILSLPTVESIIGKGMDDNYCYVMLSDGKICSLRLLPKGFGDSEALDSSLLVVPELDSLDDSLIKMHQAFSLFANKDIVKASVEIQPLLEMTSSQLAAIVHSFALAVLDNGDLDASPESELRNKKVVAARFILFLKHMGVLDKVSIGKTVVTAPQRLSRSGASILAEMTERICVAQSLFTWQSTSDDRSLVIEEVSEAVASRLNVSQGGDMQTILFDKLSMLHELPSAVVEWTATRLSSMTSPADRFRLLHLTADLLLTYAAAIDAARRSTTSVVVPDDDVQWTVPSVTNGFLQMCLLTLTEMKNSSTSRNEKSRLKDSVVRLCVFLLGESTTRPDGHPVLNELCDQGEEKLAVDLAERFKDFLVLCRVHLRYDRETRTDRLDAYKKRFAADDFDLYLCNYLKQKNMNEELLEQRGERADKFMSSLSDIRWRRELQNGQYEEASSSLNSLASRNDNDLTKQKSLYSLSRLAALCADKVTSSTDADRELEMIKHQQNVPVNVIQMIYPAHCSQRLSSDELVEVWKAVIEDDHCPVHHYISFLSLLSTLLDDDDSPTYSNLMDWLWANAAVRAAKAGSGPESHLFEDVLATVLEKKWNVEKKAHCLPVKERLFKEMTKMGSQPNSQVGKLLSKACDRARRTVDASR